jgi:hypothetical protein
LSKCWRGMRLKTLNFSFLPKWNTYWASLKCHDEARLTGKCVWHCWYWPGYHSKVIARSRVFKVYQHSKCANFWRQYGWLCQCLELMCNAIGWIQHRGGDGSLTRRGVYSSGLPGLSASCAWSGSCWCQNCKLWLSSDYKVWVTNWILLNAMTRRNEHENVICVVGIGQDITAHLAQKKEYLKLIDNACLCTRLWSQHSGTR